MRIVRFLHAALPESCYGWIPDSSPDIVQVLPCAPWLVLSELTGSVLPLAECTLLYPCEPTKIVCVGKNYRDHVAEMTGLTGDGSVPTEPLLFLKPPSALIGPNEPICHPVQSQRMDYEGELALVVGQVCRNQDPAGAQACIWGYTIANDVTARDLQQTDQQWARAKGFDTFCPLGPWVVSDLDPQAQIQTSLNGQTVQSSSIDQMVFGPAELVSYISQAMTLMPGDIVLTGTPGGIGPMVAGDRVRVAIDGIGQLDNPVIGP